ncbi:MAG: SRPBCC family protein [Bacteroidota bacterium]
MNTLVFLLLIIVALVMVLLIIGLFSQRGYSIKRNIVIRQKKEVVFDYIKLLKNQDHYNKWVMMDPAMQKVFTGTDGKPGFVYAWDGNNKAGAGEQEIMTVTEGKGIVTEVRFKRPFNGIAYSTISCEAIELGQTKLIWEFNTEMKYPANIMLLFIKFDKILGKDIELSLQNLNGILRDQSSHHWDMLKVI